MSFNTLLWFLAFNTIVINVITLLLFIYFFINRKYKFAPSVEKVLNTQGLLFAFIIATAATIGSLFLSEVAKFPPCDLCWYQRVFMYPQVILFGIALIRDDTKVKLYSLVLSVIGLLIAIYHTALQLFPTILPCTNSAISCSQRSFVYFGYVTIPVMSASAFMLLIVLMLYVMEVKKKLSKT